MNSLTSRIEKTSFTKRMLIAAWTLLAVLLIVSAAHAEDESEMNESFSQLGTNEAILQRARQLDPKNKIHVVQKRAVDRHLRLEVGGSYAPVAGGNSYLSTQDLGGYADFHLTPRWSLGVRFTQSFNSLTADGKQAFDTAQAKKSAGELDYNVPDIDYPKQSLLGVLSFYPIYAKSNVLDLAIMQFDFYGLIGAGQTTLLSGPATTLTAGGGIGFWVSQHFTSRLELRWQGYKDQVYTGSRDLNLVIATASVGFLL